MFKARVLKIFIPLFVASLFLGIATCWAEVSVTLISFKNHPRSIQSQKESLAVLYPPNTQIKYLEYSDFAGRKLLNELGFATVPQVVYKQGIEEEKDFLQLVRNGVIEKRKGRYILPERTVTDILGKARFFFKRKATPRRLDLFVMSACPFGVAAEKRIINYLRREKIENIELKIHYLVNLDTDKKLVSVHGDRELEEDIRQIYVQKFFPAKFSDYLLSINQDNFLDYKKRLESFGIDEKAIEQFNKEAEKELKQDLELSDALGVFSSPSILWENQYFVESYLPHLAKITPFDSKLRWLKKNILPGKEEKDSKPKLEYFYALFCNPCQEVKNKIMVDFKRKYPNLTITEYDVINDNKGKRRLSELEEEYGLLTEAGVPTVYFQGNLVIGHVEIEKSLPGILEQELGKKELTKPTQKPWKKLILFYTPAKTFLNRYASLVVFLLLLIAYLKGLNYATLKSVFLIVVFLLTAIGSLLFIHVSIPVGIKYLLALPLFSVLFFLGLINLYAYFEGKEIRSKVISIVQKARSDRFLFFSALFFGFLASFLSAGQESSYQSIRWTEVFLILGLFSLVLFTLTQNRFLINLFRRHLDLARLLNSVFLFMLSVCIWLFK
jgi:thiol-disulfide isomerase/thioredoxin